MNRLLASMLGFTSRPSRIRQRGRVGQRLEVLEGVTHWLPELAAERVAELVTAHVRTA